jgi:hypothetical protein
MLPDRGQVIIIDAPTGVGKTRGTLERLIKEGILVLWIARTRNNCNSAADEVKSLTGTYPNMLFYGPHHWTYSNVAITTVAMLETGTFYYLL